MEEFDFEGWATKNDLKCSDGRTIRRDAFIDNDGMTVPLVWNHQHSEIHNVLGHALLLNKPEGVRTYGKFNDTADGQYAKSCVRNGDITQLSIYANNLTQRGGDVVHGNIREVSLVLAGANPGAFIDSVIKHGESCDDEAVIYTGEDFDVIIHADGAKTDTTKKDDMAETKTEEQPNESSDDKTVEEVIAGMDDDEKTVLYALVGTALESEDADDTDDTDTTEGGNTVKHNVFAQDVDGEENVIKHSEIEAAMADFQREGSMKNAFLAHGIADIDMLFPEAKPINGATPEFIQRDMAWVSTVMNNVHKSPFARIKSVFADITEDEARARGYIKGKLKKEEVFGLLKRVTIPCTIYKKQKFDRDDLVDITDFDVVAWVKSEMRMMLDEEIARAILFGDGRSISDNDKVNEQNVRPVWTDEDLYTVKTLFTRSNASTEQEKEDADARAFIRAAVKSRKQYKGSGNPVMFMTRDMLINCLLLEDKDGRIIYDTEEKLRTRLGVSQIVTPEVMDDLTRTVGSEQHKLEGLYLNLRDYNVGTDRKGRVTMFDDFDIDYNQQIYLIEGRMSGAMTKPFGAVAIESKAAA